MEQDQNNKGQDNPENSTNDSTLENSGSQQPEKQPYQDDAPKTNQETNEIIINNQPQPNKTSNIIAAISAGATIVLLIFNYLLYKQVYKHTNSIRISAVADSSNADVYKRMLIESHAYDSMSIERQDSAFNSNAESSKKSVEISKKYADAAEKSSNIAAKTLNVAQQYAIKSDSNFINSINIAKASCKRTYFSVSLKLDISRFSFSNTLSTKWPPSIFV